MVYSITSLNKKFGVSDSNGSLVIPPVYNEIKDVTAAQFYKDSNGERAYRRVGKILFALRKGKLWALADTNGTVLTPFQYSEICIVQTNALEVRIGKKLGVLDTNGQEILPVEYDYFDDLGSDIFRVQKDKLFGFVNKQGKAVVPIVYQGTQTRFTDGLVSVVLDGKAGFVNEQGTLVIPHIYKGLALFRNGYAIVRKDNKFGVINLQNDVIIPFFEHSLFHEIEKLWVKPLKLHHRLHFKEIFSFLENGLYPEALAFLTTTLHFQTQGYHHFYKIQPGEIHTALEKIDRSHKLSKKLLPLLEEIKQLYDNQPLPESGWPENGDGFQYFSKATDYEFLTDDLKIVVDRVLENQIKVDAVDAKGLLFYFNATNGYIDVEWLDPETLSSAARVMYHIEVKELWEMSLEHNEGANFFDKVANKAIYDTAEYFQEKTNIKLFISSEMYSTPELMNDE